MTEEVHKRGGGGGGGEENEEEELHIKCLQPLNGSGANGFVTKSSGMESIEVEAHEAPLGGLHHTIKRKLAKWMHD